MLWRHCWTTRAEGSILVTARVLVSLARRAGPDPPARWLKALWRALQTDHLGGTIWIIGGLLVHAAALGFVNGVVQDPRLRAATFVNLVAGVVATLLAGAIWWHFIRLWIAMCGDPHRDADDRGGG